MSEFPVFTVTHVQSFDEIAEEFAARINRMVWCNVASIDSRQRPRSRVMHPVWEGATGWVFTFRDSPKSRHIAACPALSLAYIGEPFKPVYIDCTAAWCDDPAERERVAAYVEGLPAPMGYRLMEGFGMGIESPKVGLLRLTPWRVEVYTIPAGTRIWQPEA